MSKPNKTEIGRFYGVHRNTVRNWEEEKPELYQAMVLYIKKRQYCPDCGLLTIEKNGK